MFIPGDLGNSSGSKEHVHTENVRYVPKDDDTHTVRTYCTECGEALGERAEAHAYKDGVCAECGHVCAHTRKIIEYQPANTQPRWDGKYLYRKYLKTTSCQSCETELGREETEFRSLHTHTGVHDSYAPCDGNYHYDRMYCTDCGLPFSEYEGHEWVLDGEKADESNETHILLHHCEKCGETGEGREPHTWENVLFQNTGDPEKHTALASCPVCGIENREITLPHAWEFYSVKEAGGPEGHIVFLKCGDCGAVKEEQTAHEWVHYAYTENGDPEKHEEILKCTVCGATKMERSAHEPVHLSWTEISDTQHEELVRCKICGLAYTKGPSKHWYDFTDAVYESDGQETHSKYLCCADCNHVDRSCAFERTEHEFSRRGFCIYCQLFKYEHEHSGYSRYPDWTPLDETYHCPRYLCNSCWLPFLATNEKRPHNIDPETEKCRDCGYLKEYCEHEFGETKLDLSKITEEEHVFRAQCTKCGLWRTVTEEHAFRYEKIPGTGMHRAVCTVCGYSRTE